MKALDLYAGGGGITRGLQLAGMDVTMVDFVERQSRPDGATFIKADCSDVMRDLGFLRSFDFITASPPCKENTRLAHLRDAQGGTPVHLDMIPETRAALEAAGVPYMIENVEGAPLRPDVMLCGSMFDLHVYDSHGARRWLKRHRLFELGGWGNAGLGIQPECQHPAGRPLGVYGSLADEVPDGGQTCETLDQARDLMGTPWLSWASITQAIPPVYGCYLASCWVAETMGVGVSP
jgi:DNA (cytosine-5)-methyltransferase 1